MESWYVVRGTVLAVLVVSVVMFVAFKEGSTVKQGAGGVQTSLVKAKLDGSVSIEKAIHTRRSVRSYKNKPVTIEQLSQLLWAAQGITSKQGLRASPSAGALYPMELYVVASNVTDLDEGVYKYDQKNHRLQLVKSGRKQIELADASLGQTSVSDGAVSIVITGIYERTSSKYGDRAVRYVHMEAGHIAQNIYLQCVSLGLGTVVVGAFDDDAVQLVIGAQADKHPLYVMPVGVK